MCRRSMALSGNKMNQGTVTRSASRNGGKRIVRLAFGSPSLHFSTDIFCFDDGAAKFLKRGIDGPKGFPLETLLQPRWLATTFCGGVGEWLKPTVC